MNPNDYQRAAMRTANKDLSQREMLLNGVLGLSGETGEVADHVKKAYYQGHDLDRDHLIEEVGDCLWYCCLTLTALDMSLEECMRRNIVKLYKRYPDGFDMMRSIFREDEAHD